MIAWIFVEGGIRKMYSWGYSEIFQSDLEKCFSEEEILIVAKELSGLSKDLITKDEEDLLTKVKIKRSELKKKKE